MFVDTKVVIRSH